MSARDRLNEARKAEREARTNWLRSLDIAQARFAPNAIAENAVSQIKETAGKAARKVSGKARKRPGMLIAAGAALGLILFRKPIASAIQARISKRKETAGDFCSLPAQKIREPADGDDRAPVTIITEEV